MKSFYKPSDIIIYKIYNCKDVIIKKNLVLEQLDKMSFQKGKNFQDIRARVVKSNDIRVIDQAFTNLILVGEGLKVL